MASDNRSARQARDHLRDGLVLLCRELGHPLSENELVDGLPMEQGRLPLRLAPRALRRADINARVEIGQQLHDLKGYLLPALLLLNDGRSALLVGVQNEQADLLLPQSAGGHERITLDVLGAMFSGVVVFAKPRYRDDGRAGDLAQGQQEHWFFGAIRQMRRSYLEVAIAAMIANLLAIASALFAMQVYDRVVPNSAFDTLWILASGVALAILLESVLRVLRGHLLTSMGKRIDLRLSTLLFERALQTRLAAKPASVGAFSSQIREFESVREFFTASSAAVISDLPFVVIFLLIIAVIGGHLVWVPVIAVLLMLLPALLAQGHLAHLSRQNLREGAVKNGILLESIEHLETVKAARAEGRCLKLWENLTAQLAGSSVKTHNLTSALSYGVSLVQQMCYVAVVVFGVYRISDGLLTIGALIACSILSSRAIAPLSQSASLLGRWQHTKVALEGLDQMMSGPVERTAGRSYVRKPRLAGDYKIQALTLAHGEGPTVVDVQALHIRAGERVALLGGNGAGKSSLLRLFAGLADASSGRLLLDDIGIEQIDPSDRRQNIGYLPQDVALLYGTLRENLNLENASLSDDDLFEALDGVGLGEWVRNHSLGLDMPIQGNASLSGGQRQAIGLARVLLQDPPIVLLDEPTAAFDQTSEKHVLDYLRDWLKGRTLVLVTHKKSMLELVERAVVMRQGRVIMDGSLDQVVQDNRVQPPQDATDAREAIHGI